MGRAAAEAGARHPRRVVGPLALRLWRPAALDTVRPPNPVSSFGGCIVERDKIIQSPLAEARRRRAKSHLSSPRLWSSARGLFLETAGRARIGTGEQSATRLCA